MNCFACVNIFMPPSDLIYDQAEYRILCGKQCSSRRFVDLFPPSSTFSSSGCRRTPRGCCGGWEGPWECFAPDGGFRPLHLAFSCVLAAPRTFRDLPRVSAEPLRDSVRQSGCISLVSHLQVLEFVALSTGLSHYGLWWLSRYLLQSLTSWCHRPLWSYGFIHLPLRYWFNEMLRMREGQGMFNPPCLTGLESWFSPLLLKRKYFSVLL